MSDLPWCEDEGCPEYGKPHAHVPVERDPYLDGIMAHPMAAQEPATREERTWQESLASSRAAPAEPTVSPPVAGALVTDDNFNSRWEQFVTNSIHPEYYNASHKAVAQMGYVWAISAFRKFGNRIT